MEKRRRDEYNEIVDMKIMLSVKGNFCLVLARPLRTKDTDAAFSHGNA